MIDAQVFALNWALMGVHVFPLPSGKKHPPPKGWPELATCDPEVVKRLFPKGKSLNIGIVPGKSGHVVIDVDGPEGVESMKALFGGKPPKTLCWRTGRGEGGLHFMYRLPEGFTVRSRRIADGLDVKSDRGYVLVPPSLHPSGRVYTTETNDVLIPVALSPGQAAKIVTASGPGRDERGAPDQDSLRAPSVEALREAVATIPNDETWDRDQYIRMGAAIKASWPDDEEMAFNLWRDWAVRWTEGVNEPEILQRDWQGLHPPFAIGWDWIAGWSREYGAPDPGDAFLQFATEEMTPEQSRLRKLGGRSVKAGLNNPELIKPPETLVPYLGWRGRLTYFWGQEKLGKSTTARSMIIDALQEGLRVLWLDFEEGESQWFLGTSLIKPLKEAIDALPEEAFIYAFAPPGWDEVNALIDEVKPDVIVVDSLTTSIETLEGKRPDESSASAWAKHMLKWKRPYAASIILGHAIRKGDRYAGSHGIGLSVDAIMGLKALSGGDRRLYCVGARAGIQPDEVVLELQKDGSVQRATPQAEAADLIGAVYNCIAESDSPVTRTKISEVTGIERTRKLPPLLAIMEKDDVIREGRNGWELVEPSNVFENVLDSEEEEDESK